MKIILLMFLIIDLQTFAHAYVDPGGISAFFQLLLASIITSFFFLKSYLKNIFDQCKYFYQDLKLFLILTAKNYTKNIIFCESTSYSIYFFKIIENLNENKIEFFYLCKKNDENIKKFEMKKKDFAEFNFNFFIFTYLSLLKCENLLLTTPDLGKKIKISVNCKKKIYFFHSVVSTNMIYKHDAFDHYTDICCVGKHHINEFNETFKTKNLNINLIKAGYPFLDLLMEKKNTNQVSDIKNNILIAPSWNPNSIDNHSFIYKDTIHILLKNNYNVSFRPHPEFLKRFKDKFDDFMYLFKDNTNFKINLDEKNLNSLFNSDYLITDWSGIAFEFAYICKKPVIFADVPKKIQNSSYENYESIPIEISEREKIGYIYKINKNNIIEIMQNLEQNKDNFKNKIEESLKNNIYNLGSSSQVISKILS